MGTSKTSTGPGKNVPLVPDWVAPDAKPAPNPTPPLTGPADGGPPSPPKNPPDRKPAAPDDAPRKPEQKPIELAPPQRFKPAKLAIGRFAKTGEANSLRKALGSYVRKGYGGSGTATQRMRKSSTAAAGVYNILSSGSTGGAEGGEPAPLDVRTLSGLPHDEVAERIAEAVNPGDISLDDAGVREAVAEAVSSVLSENDGVDITALPPELVEECYIRTLSVSAFNILIADIGASVQRAAHGNAELANNRLKEISDFMRETYRAQYAKLTSRGLRVSRGASERIARELTSSVMDIFESYLE